MRYNNCMRKLLFISLMLLGLKVFATQYQYPVPKDVNNTPIYGGLGLPFSGSMTPTTNAYDNAVAVTAPLTGSNSGRQYRHIAVYNPSTTRTVYVCFGGATSSGCADNMIVAPGYTVVLDSVYYGELNNITKLYAKLDSAGTSAVVVHGW